MPENPEDRFAIWDWNRLAQHFEQTETQIPENPEDRFDWNLVTVGRPMSLQDFHVHWEDDWNPFSSRVDQNMRKKDIVVGEAEIILWEYFKSTTSLNQTLRDLERLTWKAKVSKTRTQKLTKYKKPTTYRF